MTVPEYFCRARDLLTAIPRVDLHLHTTYTDGRSTIRNYLEAARLQRIRVMAFCEHVNRGTDWFASFRRELKEVSAQFQDVLVLGGIEVRADGFNGELNANESLLEQAQLIMGVIHRYPDGRGSVLEVSSLSRDRALDLEYRATLGLLSNRRVQILGHPGATFEAHFDEFPLALYEDIVERAIENQVAVELNPAYQRNFPAFVRLCIERNAVVSLGSNAHCAAELGRVIRAIEDVVNCSDS